MRVRLRFKKYGPMKFLGHLDVLRYFQRVFIRAKLDLEYTEGFKPRLKMSFASPLGLGITGDNEYLDIEFKNPLDLDEALNKINENLSRGFQVNNIVILKEVEKDRRVLSSMALLMEADYCLSLKDGYDNGFIGGKTEFQEKFQEFYNRKEIIINKVTKRGQAMVDIRPMIKSMAFNKEAYEENLKNRNHSLSIHTNTVMENYKNDNKIYLEVSTGSVENLKPELVMETFYNHYGLEFNPYGWQVHRMDLYGKDQVTGKQVSLSKLKI